MSSRKRANEQAGNSSDEGEKKASASSASADSVSPSVSPDHKKSKKDETVVVEDAKAEFNKVYIKC
jgi:hypothetical protein